MSFGLRYDQLLPVANKVRAGIVSLDGNNPQHCLKFRQIAPRFYGALCAAHGAELPQHRLDAVLNRGIMDVDVLQVSFGPDSPVLDAGLATGARSFGIEPDSNNNLKFFPVYHGEDMCVDKEIAALFREYTKCLLYPKGIGAGTWLMGEQIRRSISDEDWVFGGRDNEHFVRNASIRGVMDKFGADHGTELNSAVLQLNELTHSIKSRFGASVTTQALPSDKNIFENCPNNFLTRWSSEDGKQQIAVVFRRLDSVLDPESEPVVWAKIKSNGNLPNRPMLKEVLASLLTAGHQEIKDRGWTVPMGKLYVPNGLNDVFAAQVPVVHLHAHKEETIIKEMLGMQANHRIYGREKMVSGYINFRNVRDPMATFGRTLPAPTLVNGIDMGAAANEPYFNVLSIPQRPDVIGLASKNNNQSLAA